MAATADNDAHIAELCRYIAGALGQDLAADVTAKTQDHILDTFAAMVSGSHLGPGRMAIKYAETLGGAPEAQVVGTGLMTTAVNAALANGMMAHADETDDSHLASRSHLGCSVVPGALAMAEKCGRDGTALIRAVALGYDIGARFNLALNLGGIDDYSLCTHSHGPGFGTAAAAAALAGATATDVRNVLAFSAQQASGLKIYMRDQDHLEKAFDFGGMPARNGVTSACMVATGFTGVPDAICGKDGYLANFSGDPRPGELAKELGSRFEIMAASIKKWSVGSPIQAALDSLEVLIAENRITAGDVAAIDAHMPDDRAFIVDDRDMPDINLQHLLAVMLLDGGLSFATSHDEGRMADAATLELKGRITLVPEAFLTQARPERQAIIKVTLRDGKTLEHRTYDVRGTPGNPMGGNEVDDKALGLMAPIIGNDKAQALVQTVRALDKVDKVSELRAYLGS